MVKKYKTMTTNGYNIFEDALNDALDYQRIKKNFKKYQHLSHILTSITGRI